jgi:hypothetical protein
MRTFTARRSAIASAASLAHPQTEDHNPITFSKRERCASQHNRPPDVRFGSFTTDAVEATRACMSAVARKRTSSRSSRYVRLVPLATERSAKSLLNHLVGAARAPAIRPTTVMEYPKGHSALVFAALMIGVQRAISLFTSAASGC